MKGTEDPGAECPKSCEWSQRKNSAEACGASGHSGWRDKYVELVSVESSPPRLLHQKNASNEKSKATSVARESQRKEKSLGHVEEERRTLRKLRDREGIGM